MRGWIGRFWGLFDAFSRGVERGFDAAARHTHLR